MDINTDTEEKARENFVSYYGALDALDLKAHRRTNAETIVFIGSIYDDGGLSQFRNARELAVELRCEVRCLRLTRKSVRMINGLIRLAKVLRRSRHVTLNRQGMLVLAGCNGVVPSFRDGQDWVMTAPTSSEVAACAS